MPVVGTLPKLKPPAGQAPAIYVGLGQANPRACQLQGPLLPTTPFPPLQRVCRGWGHEDPQSGLAMWGHLGCNPIHTPLGVRLITEGLTSKETGIGWCPPFLGQGLSVWTQILLPCSCGSTRLRSGG